MKSRNTNFTIYILITVVLAASLVWYSFYSNTFIALAINDSMDYASIARNIAEGRGFLSSYITPLGLAHKGLPHPDLWRAPAWPVVLALFIKLFGAIDQSVAIASGFFYIAALPLLFLLARYWFGEAVAVGASIIYIFSAQNLRFSISGLTEPISLFMMVLIVYIMYMPRFRNTGGDILLGITTGLFYLARYNALLFLPLILMCRILIKRSGGTNTGLSTETRLSAKNGFVAETVKTGLLICIPFIVTVLPWLWRNYNLMHDPLFSLQKYEPVMFTKIYPGYSLYTMLEKVNVTDFIFSHQAEMFTKIAENWHDFLNHLFDPVFTGVGSVLFILFLIALVLPFNDRQKWFRPFMAACFGLQLAALMVIHYIPRLFFMFMPFYIIYGLAVVDFMTERISHKKSFAAGCIVLAAVVLTLTNLADWKEPNIKEPLVKGYSQSLKKAIMLTNSKQLILSNDGHLLAWYGDRNSAKLPYSTDMLHEITELAPVKMIYLSGRMSWNIPEADDSWRKVFWGKPQQLYDFRLMEKFDDGSLLYVRK